MQSFPFKTSEFKTFFKNSKCYNIEKCTVIQVHTMVDCAVFVYKHKFCCHGELFIGNNGYEIIYDPEESSRTESTDKSSTKPQHNTSALQTPTKTVRTPRTFKRIDTKQSKDHLLYDQESSDTQSHHHQPGTITASPSPSRLMLSFIGHLGNLSPSSKPECKRIHRILIDWDTISGLQRINKEIKYSSSQSNPSSLRIFNSPDPPHTISDPSANTLPQNGVNSNGRIQAIKLSEQLIIESTTYPKLQILEYNELQCRYEIISNEPLRTHYIGLEYDLSDAHRVLLGTNYHQIHKYNLPDTEDTAFSDFDGFDLDSNLDSNIDSNLNAGSGPHIGHELRSLSLLEGHPSYALLLNHSLPAWIWVPLLNHSVRVLVERVILLGNISLFLWTIYQMTKYTSIIKTFYELVVFPLFEYISQPLLKKWYYVLNLMRFNVVVQLISSLFSAFYNFIPINELYRALSFIDQHIVQQILSLLAMFYRLVVGLGNVLWPCFDVIGRCLARAFSLIEVDCICCKRMSALWTSVCCNARCWSGLQFMWQCLMRCCRLCQRSQSLTDSSTQILKAGASLKDGADELNAMNAINVNADSAWRACNAVREIWRYCKSIIDVFWLSIGKPIKHSYDFFRYIRSEVGTVVAFCIRKCCRKSKEKVKIAGKRVLEEAKMRVPSLDRTRSENASDQSSENSDGGDDEEKKENINNEHSQSEYQRIKLNVMEMEGLRHRGKRGSRSLSEEGDGEEKETKSILRKQEDEHKEPMYKSAVHGIPYFKDQDI